MNSLKASMSLEEARKTKWVFRDIKGQEMGKLLDAKQLSSQDLAYAVERAYDSRVKEAAKVLLIDYLARENTDTGSLQLIASGFRSFAERRQIQLSMMNGLIVGILFGAYLLLMIQSLFFRPESNLSDEQRWSIIASPQGIIGIIILIVLFVAPFFIIEWISDKLFEQMALHRKGQIGEEQVLNALYANLDGTWTVFRNLELNGYGGDIDFVLVGDRGVWALEVKAYDGEFRNIGKQWERRFGSYWLPTFANPDKQVRKNATNLNRTFKNNNLTQWIEPIIVWANADSKLELHNPATTVFRLEELNNLSNLTASKPIPKEQKEKIIEVLKKASAKDDAEK